MITELTKEQQDLIPTYLQRGLDSGLRTVTTDRAKAEECVLWVYNFLSIPKPKHVIHLKSLSQINHAIAMIAVNNTLTEDIVSTLQLSDLPEDMREAAEAVGFPLTPNTYKDFLEERKKTNFFFTWSTLWQAYYRQSSYLLDVVFPEKIKEFPLLPKVLEFFDNVHGIVMFSDIVFICDYPEEIHMLNGQLHKDCGPSVRYRDGFEVHTLHGIQVTKEVAMLRPDTITKDIIINEKNADIRREIVRKLTPAQLIEKLNPEIADTQTIALEGGQVLTYSLLMIDLGDARKRPYLKMENPSEIGVVHVEGVAPHCRTVLDALEYRNGTSELPYMIS